MTDFLEECLMSYFMTVYSFGILKKNVGLSHSSNTYKAMSGFHLGGSGAV